MNIGCWAELKIFIHQYAKITATTENWHEFALQTNDQIRKRGRYIEYGWKFEFSRSVHASPLYSEVEEGRRAELICLCLAGCLLSLCHLHSWSCCTVRSLSGFWFVCIGHGWEKEVGIRKSRNCLCVQLCKPFWIGDFLYTKGFSGGVHSKCTLRFKTSPE